ncbi:MAG TPA: ABC transporter permease [Candidatus Didemnitutus sp.]|nr:ABC transporter permease [Candidatus Didemnitutus sp.]
MRHFFTILSHEIRSLLFSGSTYIAAVLFLDVMAFFFAQILEDYTKAPQENPPAAVFFRLFWIPVWFMVPLLTMRSIAEERRLGTLETLLTTPASTAEIVLGKFGASYLLYLFMWGMTVGFHYLLHYYARDAHMLDPAPLVGGYSFIAVSGLLYVAVGIFASSLTRSQAVAGIFSCVVLIGLTIGPTFLSSYSVLNEESLKPAKLAVDSLQISQHLDDFTHGVIDIRQVIFYVSGAALALIFSVLGVEAKLLQG